MRRDQLEHLIRAAGHALGVDEVIVIGSQAVLASVPFGLPVEAVRSIEADILPIDDPDEAKADLIDCQASPRFRMNPSAISEDVRDCQRIAKRPLLNGLSGLATL